MKRPPRALAAESPGVAPVPLYHEVHGTEDGEPLLLVHGLGSSCRDWQHQLDAFTAPSVKPYRVITCDLRGHGRSPRPKRRYHLDDLVADIEALLVHLDLQRVHLLGISMGAIVTLELAARRPDLVRSLVLVSCPPALPLHDFRTRRIYLQRRLLITLLGMPAVAWVLARRLFPGPEQADLRRQFRRRWRTNDRWSYLRCVHALMGWQPPEDLGHVDCLVLAISGDRDYWTPAQQEALIRRLPRGRLEVMSDAGHAGHIERPDVFNQLVLDFLENATLANRAPAQ